ncbi:MAG: hypothetical protein SF029_23985 [bacterium]|nr:hypothetical protein [bacterium]
MNPEFEDMQALLLRYEQVFRSPHLKAIFRDLYQRLERGIRITERDIEDALNGALRGSQFSGDWVGRPADDFDDEDDEDNTGRIVYF